MANKDLGQCQEIVLEPGGRGFFTNQCNKKGKVIRNVKLPNGQYKDKVYCTIHDPEYIKEKQRKRTAKWNKEWEEKTARSNLTSTAVKACKKINPDNPQAAAEALPDFYEALKDIIKQANMSRLAIGADLADSINVFGKQAIAKAEAKES